MTQIIANMFQFSPFIYSTYSQYSSMTKCNAFMGMTFKLMVKINWKAQLIGNLLVIYIWTEVHIWNNIFLLKSTLPPQQTKCVISIWLKEWMLVDFNTHPFFYISTHKIFTLSSGYLNSFKLLESTSGPVTKSECFSIFFSCVYFAYVSQSILLGVHFLQDISIRFAAVTNGVVIVVIVLNILSAICK